MGKMAQAGASYRSNCAGIKGWFWGGNYKMERYLFIIHRVTGLGLLLFFGFHIFETTYFRIQGQSAWEAYTGLMKQPVFEAGQMVFILALVIHAVNGLRLVFLELGFGMGRPQRPVFPFRDALRRKRLYVFVSIAAIIIIMLLFLFNLCLGGA